jgi:hypothetical protein
MPDEIGEETVGEGEGLADLVVINDDEQEDAETEDTEETEAEDTEAEVDDDETETVDEGPDEAEKLRAEVKKEINRLGFMVRKGELDDLKAELKRLKAEKEDPEDVRFTDAQLLQMMKDHREEPEVMFQIMKQMQKQAGEDITQNAQKASEVAARKKELSDLASNRFPNALKEGEATYEAVQNTISYLGLEDNPYADVLALGVLTINDMPTIVERIREQTKKQLLSKTAEITRKGKVKETSLSEPGHKNGQKAVELSQGASETAKLFGFNDKQQALYKKFLKAGKKGGGAIQAEI